MLSSDKNVESIANFIEEVKQWLYIRKEYTKLDLIEKIVRICSALVLSLVFALLTLLILIYLSFAIAYFLSELINSQYAGFLIVCAFYIITLFIVYLKRKAWIEKPLVCFLVSILIDDNKDDNPHNNVTEQEQAS